MPSQRLWVSAVKSYLLGLLNFALQHHGRRTRDTTVLTHAPEVHHHECGCKDRDRYAVPDVGTQERVRIYDRSAQQAESDIVEWRHAQLRAERPGMSEQWCRAGHVRA